MIERLLNSKLVQLGFRFMEDFDRTDFEGICSQMSFYFLLAFSHIMAALFRGLGKSMFPMVVMLVAWCVIRVSILAVAGMIHRTFQMTYYVYPITWAISSVIFVALAFKYFKDLNKGITSKE